MVDLEDKKKQLYLEKSRLESKEKTIREKERKLKTKKLIEIGELATRAGLSEIDTEILFGAFLDVKEKSVQEQYLEIWKTLAEKAKILQSSQNSQPLIISVHSTASASLKTTLKALKFKWNPFRKEWYGYGDINQLKTVLEPFNAKIENAQLF